MIRARHSNRDRSMRNLHPNLRDENHNLRLEVQKLRNIIHEERQSKQKVLKSQAMVLDSERARFQAISRQLEKLRLSPPPQATESRTMIDKLTRENKELHRSNNQLKGKLDKILERQINFVDSFNDSLRISSDKETIKTMQAQIDFLTNAPQTSSVQKYKQMLNTVTIAKEIIDLENIHIKAKNRRLLNSQQVLREQLQSKDSSISLLVQQVQGGEGADLASRILLLENISSDLLQKQGEQAEVYEEEQRKLRERLAHLEAENRHMQREASENKLKSQESEKKHVDFVNILNRQLDEIKHKNSQLYNQVADLTHQLRDICEVHRQNSPSPKKRTPLKLELANVEAVLTKEWKHNVKSRRHPSMKRRPVRKQVRFDTRSHSVPTQSARQYEERSRSEPLELELGGAAIPEAFGTPKKSQRREPFTSTLLSQSDISDDSEGESDSESNREDSEDLTSTNHYDTSTTGSPEPSKVGMILKEFDTILNREIPGINHRNWLATGQRELQVGDHCRVVLDGTSYGEYFGRLLERNGDSYLFQKAGSMKNPIWVRKTQVFPTLTM